ncbi:MAG: O-antigen ligase family protein [Limisphaerales bacterium]
MTRPSADEFCSRCIFGLVVAILALGPLAMGGVRNEEFTLIGGLIIAATALWLVRVWLNPDYRIAWPPMSWGVLVFLVYALARYPYADVEYTARDEIYRVILYALLFFVVVNNVSHRASNNLAYVIVGVGVFMSLYALLQFMQGSDMVWSLVRPAQYAGRGSGTYICPNHLAGYLEFAIPIALAYIFLGRAKYLQKNILAYSLLIMLGGLGATVSRGGWIATTVGLLLFVSVFIFRRGKRMAAIVLLVVLVIGGFLFITKTRISQQRLDEMVVNGKPVDMRLHIWESATKLWQERPWLGLGPAQFDHQFRRYRPHQLQLRPEFVHNDYLNTLVDWGILGFLIVAGSLLAFFASSIRLWQDKKEDRKDIGNNASNRQALVLAVMIGMAAILLHSLVDFHFHIPANAMLAIGLMATVLAIGQTKENARFLTPGLPGKAVLTLILVLTATWLIPESRLKYREGQLYTESTISSLPALQEMQLLHQMHELDPMNADTTFRIGEIWRILAWSDEGHAHHAQATEGQRWMKKTIALNPWNADAHVRLGICRDILREYDASLPHYQHAEKLDPQGAATMAWIGWHHLQNDEYDLARKYLMRSLELGQTEFALEQLEILNFVQEDPEVAPLPKP